MLQTVFCQWTVANVIQARHTVVIVVVVVAIVETDFAASFVSKHVGK